MRVNSLVKKSGDVDMQSRVPGVPHSGRSFPQFCSCQLLAKLDGSPWVKAATRACLMLLTAVFAPPPHSGAQVVPLYRAYHFAAPGGVGAAAATGTVLVTASANGSLSAIRVLTQGIPNQDFTLAAGGSCAVGTAYFTGQSCTVTVSFQPKYPGLRQGAVVLLASDGNVLGSELLEATGVGATAVFVPGMISTVAGNGQWIFRGDGGLATALLATSPPTHPLAQREASGLPKRKRLIATVASRPAAADNVVLTAMSTARPGSAPVKSIAPAAFKPNHPSHVRKQANATTTASWPGMAAGMPCIAYLPRRGPKIQVTASAVRPPTA